MVLFDERFWATLFLSLFFLTGSVWAQSLKLGQEVFADRCASCHGVDARGSSKMAKNLKVDPARLNLTRSPVTRRSIPELRKFIADGHGKMPRQKDWLTPIQIKAVVRYLRTLQTSYVSKESP